MMFDLKHAIRLCTAVVPLLTGVAAMEIAGSDEESSTITNSSTLGSLGKYFSSVFQSSVDTTSNVAEETSLSSFKLFGIDKIVAKVMTPLDGTNDYWPQDWGKSITVTCLDGVKLAGHWAHNEKSASGPTMILSHGNGMVSDNYKQWALWFQDYGYNVLAVTIRGYPGSEGSSDLIRIASALDVEAVVRYAIKDLNIPQKNLALYGFSLGGPYATYASRHFGLPVILQNTLTNVGDIVENLSPVSILSCTKNAIGRSHLDKENKMPSLSGCGLFKDRKDVPLNSFDNLDNLSATTSAVMIIYAQNDGLMGKKGRAMELYQARYGAQAVINPDLFVEIADGNHVSVFLQDNKAQTAVLNFLSAVFKNTI